jgi:putative ABC transport system substrate-binding protein
VIVAAGLAATRAAKSATAALPIVMVGPGDPVRLGFVPSLARPGGNVTGTTSDIAVESWRKRLQLLTEVAPRASRIALLWNRRALSGSDFIPEGLNHAASTLNVTVRSMELGGPDDLVPTFARMTRERIGGIVFVTSADLFGHLRQIAELAVGHRIPMMASYKEAAVAGSLMSYGSDLPHIFRRSAIYVDKILKGANPADLPIEQPTRYELIINLKTAKALGLTIPRGLLLRADQVIE